jgi:hypothetical protein
MSLLYVFLAVMGQLHVTASIPPAGSVAVVSTSPEIQYAGTVLNVRGSGWASFLVRSNTGYRLHAKLLAMKGSGQTSIRLKGDSAMPAGGGSRLMPGAFDVRLQESEIDASSDDVVVASGPRISRGGNNSTLENAILIRVRVELPEGISEADFRFDLSLAGN